MIELRGVSKTVTSGGRPLTILHPLDLTIRSGQFLAVLGPSGRDFLSLGGFFELDLLKKEIGHQASQP